MWLVVKLSAAAAAAFQHEFRRGMTPIGDV